MKTIISAVLMLLIITSCKKENDFQAINAFNSSDAVANKRIYFTNTGNWVDQNFNYVPGDTFVLKEGISYTYFSMGNVHDVTIINDGLVKLQNGFNFNNCTNIHVSGTGTKGELYGFEICDPNANGVGIDINGRSSRITVNNVYIHNKTYGFWVKQEVQATCDENLYYPNFYMDSISIFNCMIKRVNQEGMYLGSTGENADRPNGCGQYPYPMRLSNVLVYNNIVDSTGRGGIMLSGCDKGKNIIARNTITRCGFEFNSYQGNGIVIGGNAYANILQNHIKNTLCDGIWVLGAGTTIVRGNRIDSSGWLNGTYAGFMHGIAFDARPSFPFRLSSFRVINNTIGKHTDAVDIYIYNTMQNNNGQTVSGFSNNNVIYNNNKGEATIGTQQGISYKSSL